MLEKAIKIVLIVIGTSLLATFFLVPILDGDFADIVWRFRLMKVHLSNNFVMPYFTPGVCGGFLLAANAQDFIFSVYALMSFLIPNIIWASKITNFLMSLVLAFGVYRWLKVFGIANQNARMFSGFLAAVSGYWVFHLSWAGQLWVHGIAYTPWIMVSIESFLKKSPNFKLKYLTNVMGFVALLFLLINSGYYWLQVSVVMIFSRVFVEIIFASQNRYETLKRLMIIGACGLFAILLSLPRIGGVYAFQLTKFPRVGGIIPHYQVIGDTVSLLRMLLRSFFDGGIIINTLHDSALAGFHEYTNFIGIMAILPLMLGISRIKKLIKSKPFIGLLIASVFQFGLTRSTHVGDLMRFVAPFYQQISFHWRGSATLIFFSIVFIAAGYELCFNSRKRLLIILALLFILCNFFEIFHTYRQTLSISMKPPLSVIFQDARTPTQPLKEHFADCNLGSMFGYGNMKPKQLTYSPSRPVDASLVPGYYNMHDIRLLFSDEADNGYYMTHDWPLWPIEDSEEFEKFINYKQVVSIPPRLRQINRVGAIAWIFYVAGLLLLLFNLTKFK